MSKPTLTRYVCGFLFSTNHEDVVLIRKTKPEWQAGKLNGVGGKIEDGESPIQAMRREFKEETGLGVRQWESFAVMTGETWQVEFFKAEHFDCYKAQTTTEETIEIVPVDHLEMFAVIPNLKWLIRMALDPHHRDCMTRATN